MAQIRCGLIVPLVALLAGAGPVEAQATGPDPLLGEDAVLISAHVYVISGFPNVAIIVGNAGTLVVDTGLGPRNGATVAKVAARLSKSPKLYLTTTHFHPEHASGEGGFLPGTVLIRARAQQEELTADNNRMLTTFQARPAFGPLLQNVTFRKPDIEFGREYDLNLGNVNVALLYVGPAHTKGDEEVLVKGDGVLITGDVVQNKIGPAFTADGIGPKAWLAAVKALEPLKPRIVVPDHSPPGDGMALIAQEEEFMKTLDDDAHALKAKGIPVEQAAVQINSAMKARFPDWTIRDQSDAVARAYSETPG